MVTIKDVAKRAGVSFKTVSRVLNNDSAVIESTREKVLESIDALGYRPNAVARGLRMNKSHVIGVITDNIATTPFSGNIIKGAAEAALQHGKILMVINTEGDPAVEHASVEVLLDRRVDGIIYAAMFHRVVDPPRNLYTVPAVLADCYSEDEHLPSVIPDEVGGGFTATELLLKKGHKKIGIINGKMGLPATIGRLAGYKQALEEYHIPVDDELIRFGGWWQEDGYTNTLELLKLPDPPTAIFCGNDRLALGAYDAIKELGYSIPDDISVIGFDNQEMIAAHARPKLTTVALPHIEMGRWAVEYLVKHEGQAGPLTPVVKKLFCPLIERDSTKVVNDIRRWQPD